MSDQLSNGNGVVSKLPGWARPLWAVLDRYGLSTFLVIVLLTFLGYLYVTDMRANAAALHAMSQEVTAIHQEHQFLQDTMREVVRLLSSIDRQMCLDAARTESERRACTR